MREIQHFGQLEKEAVLQKITIPAGKWTTDTPYQLKRGTSFLTARPQGSSIELYFAAPVEKDRPLETYFFRVLDRSGMMLGAHWQFLAGVQVGGEFGLVFVFQPPKPPPPIGPGSPALDREILGPRAPRE